MKENLPAQEYALLVLNRGKHGEGVEWDETKIDGKRKARDRVRYKADKRLFEGMTEDQLEAMLEIRSAFHAITVGLGYKPPVYEIVDGSKSVMVEFLQGLKDQYYVWSRECQRRRLRPSMALDVISFGKSIRDVSRERRITRHTVRSNLGECLNVYCELRGWV